VAWVNRCARSACVSGWLGLLGENWFADLGDKSPLSFSLLGPNITLATWCELVRRISDASSADVPHPLEKCDVP